MLINNIVTSLFPSKSVKIPDIDTEITGDNYSTLLSVFTTLEDGEYLEVNITSPSDIDGGDPTVQTIVAGQNDSYSRIPFSITTSGLHEIKVQKKNAAGEVLSESISYKALSYSKEYDLFPERRPLGEELLTLLAQDGKGMKITDPAEVFASFAKTLEMDDFTLP